MMSLGLVSSEPIVDVMRSLITCLGALVIAGPLAHAETWKTASGGALGAALSCLAFTYWM